MIEREHETEYGLRYSLESGLYRIGYYAAEDREQAKKALQALLQTRTDRVQSRCASDPRSNPTVDQAAIINSDTLGASKG